MKTSEATSIIYIDIETKYGDEPTLDQFEADKRLKDPEKIVADLEKKREKAWRNSMLNPHEGQVFCIGVAVNDEQAFVIHQETEKETMEDLDEFLQWHSFPKIVGHNLLDFDGYWLYVKGLKYKLQRVVNAFSKSSGVRLIDTMLLLDGPAWKKMTSLDKMAKILLGHSAKDDIDGSMVFDLLQAGQGEKVIRYCKKDVDILRKCYIELVNLGVGM